MLIKTNSKISPKLEIPYQVNILQGWVRRTCGYFILFNGKHCVKWWKPEVEKWLKTNHLALYCSVIIFILNATVYNTQFIGCFHTRGRTSCLDGRIVSDRQIVSCANRTNKFFNIQIVWFVRLERRFFTDDLPVEMNKSTTVQQKFTSDGQMPDDLSVQTICLSSSMKTAVMVCNSFFFWQS